MLFTPQQLPSNGIDERSKPVELKGLNFSELLDYTRSQELARTDIEKFNLDYSWIKKKISNWKDISLIDLDFLIFQMKKLTVSSSQEFSTEMICTDCGTINELILDSSQIKIPNPLRYDIRGKIFLKDKEYQFEIPTLEDFDAVFTKISRFKSISDLRIIKLISCFPDFKTSPNVIQRLVVEAEVEDIIRLATLESMFLDSQIILDYNCKQCRGGHWSISIRSLIDHVFRTLFLSGRSIETKIDVKHVR